MNLVWWIVGAFVMGGGAGMLVLALIHETRREGDRGDVAADAVTHGGVGPIQLHQEWSRGD
jgi:hypothetical protein